jgi:hypothetical protein
MKKPYQIAAGRAVQRVRQWAEEKNPAVQLMLPMIEILALAKQGAGALVREAGLRVILLAIQQEADALTGALHQHGPDRQALRWSREDGFVVVDGQKVPIERAGYAAGTAAKFVWAPTNCSSKPGPWRTKSGGRCCAD